MSYKDRRLNEVEGLVPGDTVSNACGGITVTSVLDTEACFFVCLYVFSLGHDLQNLVRVRQLQSLGNCSWSTLCKPDTTGRFYLSGIANSYWLWTDLSSARGELSSLSSTQSYREGCLSSIFLEIPRIFTTVTPLLVTR